MPFCGEPFHYFLYNFFHYHWSFNFMFFMRSILISFSFVLESPQRTVVLSLPSILSFHLCPDCQCFLMNSLSQDKMLTSSPRIPQIWYLKQNWTSSRTKCIVFCGCLVAKSCPILCNPVDCSPPGSCVPEIFQARILEWVAISISILDIKNSGEKKKR